MEAISFQRVISIKVNMIICCSKDFRHIPKYLYSNMKVDTVTQRAAHYTI